MKLHAVGKCEEQGTIMTRETSCYCEKCLSGSYCSSWKMETMQSSVARRTDTSVVSGHDQPSASDDVPPMPSQDINNGIEGENGADAVPIGKDIDMKDVDIGSVVAVVYETKWFVGKIIDKDTEDCEFEVQFMEKAKDMYKWPQYEDRLWVQDDHVLCVLSSLTPSGKSGRLFKLSQDERSLVDDLFKSRRS